MISVVATNEVEVDVSTRSFFKPFALMGIETTTFIHRNKSVAVTATTTGSSSGAMQKSKSSSSVMHHGSRLMAKKIFRSRSKSQTRPSQTPCSWTPQGSCVWNNVTGKQVILKETNLLQLSETERKVLQKVAVAKLEALDLGVSVKVPTETVVTTLIKPKRRPYLLKRKAITTSIFDANRKEASKDGSNTSGLVFGIPLTQCVENDRLFKTAAATSHYRGSDGGSNEINLGRHGSRASLGSLIDVPRADEGGNSSSESLMYRERMAGSVPGLLDTISCNSTSDLRHLPLEEENSVPSIVGACMRHIEKYGLNTLGIFRVSTSKKRIRQLREDFDSGKETTLDQEQCPHDVATLLKEFLRELPDPLLCRDLYSAFVQTQKIRNRRIQFEALQHLIQLLPPANRDTLYSLLSFLATVARHSTDTTNDLGEIVSGNKMDSTNLATVFAPNILHCIKPNSSKETCQDRPEDRLDIINIVRCLIDNYKELFCIPSELLDEVYVHMMDTNPDTLDEVLRKREADESVDDLDSESYSAPWTPTQPTSDMSIENALQNLDSDPPPTTPTEKKRTWSREEFLHESAATGGPNVSMRLRHKDRIKERSIRRKRDESASRKKKDEENNNTGSISSSAMNIISRLRGQREDDYSFGKHRSSSIESSSSTHTDDLNKVLRISDGTERRKSSPYVLDSSGVLTASLTIPVQQTGSSAGSQGIGYILDDDIPYIEDADSGRQQLTIGVLRSPTAPPRRRQRSISGSDSSVASNIQPVTGSISLIQGYDSAMGSSYSTVQNTPTSVSSSIADPSSPPSWASTPPTSPDSTNTSVNYIPDDNHNPVPKSNLHRSGSKDSPTIQKVSFGSVQEVQQIKARDIRQREPQKDSQKTYSHSEIIKSTSTPAFNDSKYVAKEQQRFTPSISNIGNVVLKSRTAEFERITKESKSRPSVSSTSTTASEKKKYTKRRYTDSRHQTRHIPDAESLDSASSKKEEKSASQTGPVYKRREIISSVPPNK